jgi:hypothetical protein
MTLAAAESTAWLGTAWLADADASSAAPWPPTRQQAGCAQEQGTLAQPRSLFESRQRRLCAVLRVCAVKGESSFAGLCPDIPPALAHTTEGHKNQRPVAGRLIFQQEMGNKSQNLWRQRGEPHGGDK